MITDEERTAAVQLTRDITNAVLEAAVPHLMKLLAVTRPNMRFSQVGEMCVVEQIPAAELEAFRDMVPGMLATMPQERDYRKQLWINVYDEWCSAGGHANAKLKADEAVDAFDAKFSTP